MSSVSSTSGSKAVPGHDEKPGLAHCLGAVRSDRAGDYLALGPDCNRRRAMALLLGRMGMKSP